MAIALEFINLIIPIKTLEKCLNKPFEVCKEENKELFGGRLWHDEHLYRDGAMSVRDIEFLIQEWIDLGLTPLERVDGVEKFKDLCIVDMFSGITRPCDWIEYSSEENIVFMKGKPKDEIIREKLPESSTVNN